MGVRYFLLLSFLLSVVHARGDLIKLTFEVPGKDKYCFYEDFPEQTTLEMFYHVIRGGQRDVTVTVLEQLDLRKLPKDEEGRVTVKQNALYHRQRGTKDKVELSFNANATYTVCFSNEFSMVSPKVVFFSLIPVNYSSEETVEVEITTVDDGVWWRDTIPKTEALLRKVSLLQNEYRLQEAESQSVASDLGHEVLWHSLLEMCFILLIGFGQVFILKRYFTDTVDSSKTILLGSQGNSHGRI